ncbi:NAD-dependent epimerase/dehydratase family protein [Actinoplanes sp. NPDC023936]|uniref:NAD-dependent epimerase/dehydratase family protein n=1 Tax=Actinoplanes sp. NPDC023936 TaxID=3154910 RepID=UPI0033EA3652
MEHLTLENLGPLRCVAVTGGLGFVGRHLVTALRRQGVGVRVLDLSDGPGRHATGVEYRQVDLRDPRAVASAIEGVDVVFHLAGNASGTRSVHNPRFDFEANAEATFTLAEALLNTDAKRLVYMSSAMVYGRPQAAPIPEEHPLQPFVPYGASKLSGEFALRALHESRGLPVVIGRSFTIYGPGEDPRTAGGEVSQFLRWHLNGLPIRMTGDPDRKTRDFSHVSDVVSALLHLACRAADGDVVNIGTGREVSLRQLADVIGEATGRAATLLADDTITDDTYRHIADISRLRSLGFQPAVDLPAGVADLARRLGANPELPSVDTVFRAEQEFTPTRMEVPTC